MRIKINLALELNLDENQLNKAEFDKEVQTNFKESKEQLKNKLLNEFDKVKINKFVLIKDK